MRADGAQRRPPHAARGRAGSAAGVLWRTLAVATATGAVALILLHAWIFWDQLVSGRLVDPVVVLKWVGSGGLCAALVLLRRSGVPLFWGRKAFTVWLLVALLHVGPANPAPAGDAVAEAHAEMVFVLPALVASFTLLSVGLFLILSRRPSPARRPAWTVADAPAFRPTAVCCRRLAPRAPPLFI